MLGELSNYPNRSPLKEMSIHRRQQVLHQEIGILGYGTKKNWKRSHLASIKTSFLHPTVCSLELFTCQRKMLSHFVFFSSLLSFTAAAVTVGYFCPPFFLSRIVCQSIYLSDVDTIFSPENLKGSRKKNNLSLNAWSSHIYIFFFQSSSSAQFSSIRELPAVNCCVYKTSRWFLWPAQCVEAFRMCSVYTVFRTFAHQRVCIAPPHCTHTLVLYTQHRYRIIRYYY